MPTVIRAGKENGAWILFAHHSLNGHHCNEILGCYRDFFQIAKLATKYLIQHCLCGVIYFVGPLNQWPPIYHSRVKSAHSRGIDDCIFIAPDQEIVGLRISYVIRRSRSASHFLLLNNSELLTIRKFSQVSFLLLSMILKYSRTLTHL